MAQLFCDVVIKNTGSERGDHFWDNAELNLLKALVLYVSNNYPPEKQNIGEVYQLLAMSSEKELNALFDVLPGGPSSKGPLQYLQAILRKCAGRRHHRAGESAAGVSEPGYPQHHRLR